MGRLRVPLAQQLAGMSYLFWRGPRDDVHGLQKDLEGYVLNAVLPVAKLRVCDVQEDRNLPLTTSDGNGVSQSPSIDLPTFGHSCIANPYNSAACVSMLYGDV